MNAILREALKDLSFVLGVYYHLARPKTSRRWWVRPIFQKRQEQGDFHNLIQEMRLSDQDMFFNYTRMTVEQFDELLALVGSLIIKKSPREPVPPAARLAITLRHLATGDGNSTLAFAYRMGKSTVCCILNETCDAIWSALVTKVLRPPSEEEWERISREFENKWNLPNCVGAIDGKHVMIRAPYKSGSLYFNYKKTFSVVLFAVCDAEYCFTYVDIGAYGSQSDGGVLRASSFGYKLNNNLLQLPNEGKAFPNTTQETPYFFVGDEAFPLQMNLMRPYGGRRLSVPNRIYNYRVSRARRCIENTFGILVARFRIFHTVIGKHPDNVDKIIKATVCLHNFVKKHEDKMPVATRRYVPPSFIDTDINGTIVPGRWREEVPTHNDAALQPVHNLKRRIGTRNAPNSALAYRDYIRDYLNSDRGSVSWQNEAIN